MKLSDRMIRMQPSATSLMAAKAREKKRLGLDVISFATGEPDCDSREKLLSSRKGHGGGTDAIYPPTNGIVPLRRQSQPITVNISDSNMTLRKK